MQIFSIFFKKIICKKVFFLYAENMSHSFLEISQILTDVRNALKSSILGQDELIDKLLITIFASGHALLE